MQTVKVFLNYEIVKAKQIRSFQWHGKFNTILLIYETAFKKTKICMKENHNLQCKKTQKLIPGRHDTKPNVPLPNTLLHNQSLHFVQMLIHNEAVFLHLIYKWKMAYQYVW